MLQSRQASVRGRGVCSGGRGGGVSLSSVMEECGAVSVRQGIPFHTPVEKKKEGQDGRKKQGGTGPPPQTLGAYFQSLDTPD